MATNESANTSITEHERQEKALQEIRWLLESDHYTTAPAQPRQPYGDLTTLSTDRSILDSVGKDILAEIVSTFLDLIESSAVIYERNGDYALSLFKSRWCQAINSASRNLCPGDNREAMDCGRWICHEYCWQSSRTAMEAGLPADIETVCGIRGHITPIVGGQDVIGAIIISYGNPPTEEQRLQKLADALMLPVNDLMEVAQDYKSRPPIILELAKKHMLTASQLIGEMTSRKKIQISLIESEYRNQSIVSSAPDPIITVDNCGRIAEFNPAAEKTFGHKRQDIIGKDFARELIPERFRNAQAEGFACQMADSESLADARRLEVFALHSSGAEVPVELSIIKLPLQGNQCFTAFMRDLSEQKQNEQQAHRLLMLEQREDFIATLTHDLKNPLIGANRILDHLISATGGKLSEEQNDLLKLIMKSNTQLLSMIKDLLLVYRLEQTTNYILLEDTDLVSIVDSCTAEFAMQARSRNIDLRANLPDNLTARIDKNAIRRVVHNLLDNALKFTPEHGSIEVTLKTAGANAILEVTDSGPGVSREDQQRLFHRFFQGREGKKYEPGTGLGLYVCRQLVELHQGTIACTSGKDKGATFAVSLPLTNTKAMKPADKQS